MATPAGASASFNYSKANSNSQAAFLPNPNQFSPALGGIYQRDLPGILQFLQQWSPKLEDTYRQSAQETLNQDFANLQKQFQLENQATSGQAANQFSNYLNYGGPQQLLQNQVADLAARQKDPEFYSVRANTANQLNQLLPGNLTGSELSNIERGLNRQFTQQGTFNLPSNTQQLQAATTYGDAGRARQMAAIGLANQALPGFRTSEAAPVNTAPRTVSDAFSKTDTSSAANTAKMLFMNPVEEALKSFNTALSIPNAQSSSKEISGGVSA